jgi:DegV family protein with EDD domain
MGIGMIAMAAARAAAGGADVQEVASVARAAVGRAQLYFLLNTLEYLQKGGRIGKAAALVGTLLSIKPMCIVKEGEVHQLGKARTFRKGVDTIQGVTRRYAPLESLCVLHSTSPDLARDVAQGLRDLLPEGGEPLIARAGPTIGTYVGPGVIGIALLQAEGAPTDAV